VKDDRLYLEHVLECIRRIEEDMLPAVSHGLHPYIAPPVHVVKPVCSPLMALSAVACRGGLLEKGIGQAGEIDKVRHLQD